VGNVWPQVFPADTGFQLRYIVRRSPHRSYDEMVISNCKRAGIVLNEGGNSSLVKIVSVLSHARHQLVTPISPISLVLMTTFTSILDSSKTLNQCPSTCLRPYFPTLGVEPFRGRFHRRTTFQKCPPKPPSAVVTPCKTGLGNHNLARDPPSSARKLTTVPASLRSARRPQENKKRYKNTKDFVGPPSAQPLTFFSSLEAKSNSSGK